MMSTNIETLKSSGVDVLEEQRPLALAASAGFADLVAIRLDNLAVEGVAQPKEIFGLYVVALSGVDRALGHPERERHTKILGEGLGSLFENDIKLGEEASLGDQDLHNLLDNNLRPETVEIILDTLMRKRVASPSLARSFGALTLDDMILQPGENLPIESDDTEEPASNIEILSGEKRYATREEWQRFRPDLVPLMYAKNPAELALNFVSHPEALSPELVGIYNLVIRWNIDSGSEFEKVEQWHKSIHGATDEGGRLDLALARDRKLLLLADELKRAGKYDEMKALLNKNQLASQDNPLLTDDQDLLPIYCNLLLTAIEGGEAPN